MKQVDYHSIYDSELAKGCITHTHLPFLKDYITLHILLRKYNVKSVLEIGTHIGEGTQIICNAVPDAKVYSIDLPPVLQDISLQHPAHKNMKVGEMCKLPYTQILDSSKAFVYSKQPCEAYFIDGEHTTAHVYYETKNIIYQHPKLIIWHDADMPEVYNGIVGACEYHKDYEIYRVTGTAIAYAVKL